jgi:hypothetical protein
VIIVSGDTILVQKEKYTTDASPSWNGYNHQGKVGIFVVLKMINDLNLTFDACKAFEMELEWLEDFSIKKENNYIAIHQVKTYNKTAPSEYKDAIWLLLAKILDFPNIENAYLHSTSKISKVDNLKTLLHEYKPPTEDTHEKQESNEKVEEVNKKQVNKKYWTPRQCHDYVKNTGKYDEAFKKFNIYTYEDGCQHCNMDDVESRIKSQLVIFYKDNTKTSTQLNRTFLLLLGLVDKHIRERHINIQVGFNEEKATINFQRIFELIIANHELPSKEYIIFRLRDRFTKLTNEYIEDILLEVQEGSLESNEILNVLRVINSVLELNDDEFLKFCIKITPNHDVDDEDPDSILNALSTLISETHMNDGLLEILKRIRTQINVEKYTFTKLGDMKLNTSYLPTTIIDSYHKHRTGRMVEKILENSHDDSLLEVDVLITKHINLESLKSEKISADIPESETNEENDVQLDKYHYRISKIKKIRMVDLVIAKGELDE